MGIKQYTPEQVLGLRGNIRKSKNVSWDKYKWKHNITNNIAKGVLRGKFITINVYIKKINFPNKQPMIYISLSQKKRNK